MIRSVSLALFTLLASPASADLVDHVDPFVGTGGHGHTFPGPTVPFGMVQLSPDTRLSGWDGCSGYHFSDSVVYGFSHTHLSGTGVSDYGDVLFMPVSGEALLVNGADGGPDTGYASRFDKASERAGAGWYEVRLADYDIDVELTAADRAGVHRYTFPKDRPAHVIVDLGHRDRLIDNWITVISDTEIAGMRRSDAWARDQRVYFHARFSQPFASHHLSALRQEQENPTPVVGRFSFGDDAGVVEVAVGISAVDADGARRNLEAAITDRDFDAVKSAAVEAWREQLSAFEIDGASDADLAVFSTSLYHSFLAPNLFVDADGRYRGMDGGVHRAEGRQHYTVFSLWDTYRATHPLFTLIERKRTRDFVRTMLAHYEQGGRLPVWELAANETDCMIGYHSVSVIADAYLKGIDDFDAELALDAMVDSATREHFGLSAYQRDGFIGADEEGESVSKTLEYAYDDACIARMAAALGRDGIAAEFGRRSQAWRHLFDPATRCFRPRRNGQWLKPYDPRRVDFHHTEANGWQYRFSAPHQIVEHIETFGGEALFEATLDSMFTVDSATTGREQADITGRIGQYAHGNEPSHHVAWLSHFTGQPERSRERVRRILDEFYMPAPDGLIGNEDCGQMSSWYVLAALGLYDVAPTSRQWLVVPPYHERMSVLFEDGHRFTTRRVGSGAVQRVTFNGEELERSFLWHDEVIAGGELVFELGAPSKWGVAPKHRPGIASAGRPVLPAPWAEAEADRFRGSMPAALACADPAAQVFWTSEPEVDPARGALYTGPILLDATTTLRLVAIEGDRRSPVVTARFDAIEHDWLVDVASTPNGEYTAGGPDALLDLRRGREDWRTGAWQGYQGQDFVATVDLRRKTPVARVGASFLQDMRSWIWMPNELVVEVSEDGVSFREAARIPHDVPDDVEGVFRRDLVVDLDGAPLRAIRVRATNYGTIPAWHPGAGGEAFLFVDEILVVSVKP